MTGVLPFLGGVDWLLVVLSATWVNETLLRLGPSIVSALYCSSYDFPLPNDCVVLDPLTLGCPVNTTGTNCTSEPLLLSRIVGAPHLVLNATTQLSFYGVWFDGAGTDQSLFFPPLVNNNLTLDRCLVSDFHGNVTIDMEACEEVVTFSVHSVRFKRIWGRRVHPGRVGLDVAQRHLRSVQRSQWLPVRQVQDELHLKRQRKADR